MKRNIPVVGIIFLLASAPLWSSSVRDRSGTYETGALSLKISWVDIYNIRPKPAHYIRSTLELRVKPEWKAVGDCRILKLIPETSTRDKSPVLTPQRQKLVPDRQTELSGIHLRGLTYECSLVSPNGGARVTIRQSLQIDQETGKQGDPFSWPLRVRLAQP